MNPSERLDATFAALADPTRRAILARLATGEASVLELAAPFAMTQPAISKHLKVLERAGLISSSRDAQRRPRRLLLEPIVDATEWLKGYRNPGTLRLTTPSDREVRMTRVFDAPRELVFKAFTDPALLKEWFYGPPGGSLSVCDVPLGVGKPFRYVWVAADGSQMGMSGVWLEIVRPERLVATEVFDEPWYPGEAVGTITLLEHAGQTTLTQTIRYASREARDMVLNTPIEHGVALGYDRLAHLLATQAAKRRKQ